mmetsp:Transcript_2458/g.7287  ORF Transcript_2458/g.7287 Transcript_2458/m.7287 type:complete len:204 (-) Transcript_2458:44-655(-)
MHVRGQRHGVLARPGPADHSQGLEVAEFAAGRAGQERRGHADHQGRRPGPRPDAEDQKANDDAGLGDGEHLGPDPADDAGRHGAVDGAGADHLLVLHREGGRLQLRHSALRDCLAEATLQRARHFPPGPPPVDRHRASPGHLHAPGGVPRRDGGPHESLLGRQPCSTTRLQEGVSLAEDGGLGEGLQYLERLPLSVGPLRSPF